MSKIQIECDTCGETAVLAVRQNHEARTILRNRGWSTKRGGGNRWQRGVAIPKQDYCPDCT